MTQRLKIQSGSLVIETNDPTSTNVQITVNGSITSTTGITGTVTGHSTLDLPLSGGTLTGPLILNADPTVALGASTKQYVDAHASGLTVKSPCQSISSTNLSATYNNGTSGVGATLTANPAVVMPTISGYTPAVNDRLLIKDQTSQFQNGVYVVTQITSPWILTRATDFDGSVGGPIAAGDYVYIQQGTLNGTSWTETAPGPFTVGTTNITFVQFQGQTIYTGGSGINIVGTTISNTGVLSVSGSSGITANTVSGAATISLTNNSLTIGTTNVALGSSTTTLSGLTAVSAGTFTGNLSGTATNATNSAITATSSSGTYYPVFVNNTSGNLGDFVNSGLTFNPSTKVLTTTTFSGALSGTATNANNLAISTVSTNATYYPTFTGSTSGFVPNYVNSALQYNPATNVFSSNSFYATAGPSNPAASATGFGLSASGSYGGGLLLVDGSYDWGIYDTAGTLNFSSATSLGAMTTRMTLGVNGNLVSGSATFNSTAITPQLTVAPPSGSAYITIQRASQSSGQTSLNFVGGTGSATWQIFQQTSDDALGFYNNVSGNNVFTLGTDGIIYGSTIHIDGTASGYAGFQNLTSVQSIGGFGYGNVFESGLTATANNTQLVNTVLATNYNVSTYTGCSTHLLYLDGIDSSLTGTASVGAAYSLYSSAPTFGLTNYAGYFNGNVTITGTTTSASFNTSSSIKLKKNIRKLSKDKLLNFSKIKPKQYIRKETNKPDFGFIAEEMVNIYPEIVDKNSNNEPTGIDYGKLTTILVAKIQEQDSEIREIKKLLEKLSNG